MAVTARGVGVGVGGAGVGVLAGEGIQQSAERGIVSQRAADFTALGVSGSTLWLAIASELGYVGISPHASATLGGVGIGTAGWYVGRRAGIAPRLVANVPNEINLAGPFVSFLVFSAVGAGVLTLTGLVN